MRDEKICSVLSRHPTVTTIEDALDYCKIEGIEATFWSVYFAARDMGRKLTRRPPEPFGEDDLRELAGIFVSQHKDKMQALATLNKLQEMNDAGKRIDWPTEKSSAAHGWELSVAQELADYAGGIPQARQIVNSL